MDNIQLSRILSEYPDKEAQSLERLMTAEEKKDYLFALKYLFHKTDKGCSIEDAKAHAKTDEEYQEAVRTYISAKIDHTRIYNTLLSARKQADMTGRGL